MYVLLQMTTLSLACVTFALSLAHALELPGKLRLDKRNLLRGADPSTILDLR